MACCPCLRSSPRCSRRLAELCLAGWNRSGSCRTSESLNRQLEIAGDGYIVAVGQLDRDPHLARRRPRTRQVALVVDGEVGRRRDCPVVRSRAATRRERLLIGLAGGGVRQLVIDG